MCGITGAFSLSGVPLDAGRFQQMVEVVAHRGPDDAGYLVIQTARREGDVSCAQAFSDGRFCGAAPYLPRIESPEGMKKLMQGKWDLFLGHRRLSILDLSPAGHQPMTSDQSNWIIYNGEIYNFLEIRKELEDLGYVFKSRSDTEIVLYAYEQWGTECVRHFNGMFAFALWDDKRKILYLARDRYGVKPLYYIEHEGVLIFGSEIKSLLKYLVQKPDVDLLALDEYFSFQNVLSDRTLFAGVKLLPPAHYLVVEAKTERISRTRYWDFDFTKELGEREEVLQERLYSIIERAIRRQCVSDVPIGCFLSGGMDSGTITSVTRSVFGRIFTFTSGFDLSEAAEHEKSFDERELAEKMANILQTEHYECVLHSGDMEAVMDELIWHLEDLRVGQCYPNYYISRLAGKFVKVVMCGVGGDELFGGYPWRYAAAVGENFEDYIQNYYRYWKRLVDDGEKLELFNADTIEQLKSLDDNGVVPFKEHTITMFKNIFGREIKARTLSEQVNNSLYFECKTFLHGLLLVEDKISMAHSLEARVPFLDNELVDFACQIPIRFKVAGIENLEKMDENILPRHIYQQKMNSGKNILRKAMERLLPPQITSAKKQGFSAPDESWYRGQSEKYVRSVLLNKDARINEYLNPAFVEKTLTLHTLGRENKRLLLWSLLSFEKWLELFQ